MANEEGGVMRWVKGGLVAQKRHHWSWNEISYDKYEDFEQIYFIVIGN